MPSHNITSLFELVIVTVKQLEKKKLRVEFLTKLSNNLIKRKKS